MKHFIYIMIVTCTFIVACDFETSNNGDLDGFWQLYQIDTLATGNTTDMRHSNIHWSVQVNILEIKIGIDRIMFRFEKSNNKLRIWDPIANAREISDSIVTDNSLMLKSGVTAAPGLGGLLEAIFDIEKLNSDKMILTNDTYRLHLRKY
jgi:hypothetical protein